MRALGLVELKLLLVAAVVGYLGIAGLIWAGQEGMIFLPRPVLEKPRPPAGWQLEEVALLTRDGTRLAGVLVLPPESVSPLVVYFGGNAEEVTANAPSAAAEYGTRAVLLVNYRGYGDSQGKPGEKALVADAVELIEWARRHPRIDAKRIAIHGRSLGSAVAVQAAAATGPNCVVLTSPFGSAVDVARELYPWLPVRLLLRHAFDSAMLAAQLKMPALFLVGEDDRVIAPHHSDRLAKAWGGPAAVERFPGFGHNDLHLTPRYGEVLRAFLDRHL